VCGVFAETSQRAVEKAGIILGGEKKSNQVVSLNGTRNPLFKGREGSQSDSPGGESGVEKERKKTLYKSPYNERKQARAAGGERGKKKTIGKKGGASQEKTTRRIGTRRKADGENKGV